MWNHTRTTEVSNFHGATMMSNAYSSRSFFSCRTLCNFHYKFLSGLSVSRVSFTLSYSKGPNKRVLYTHTYLFSEKFPTKRSYLGKNSKNMWIQYWEANLTLAKKNAFTKKITILTQSLWNLAKITCPYVVKIANFLVKAYFLASVKFASPYCILYF